MHNESRIDRPDEPEILDPEPVKKESWLRRNGHVVFWGTMVAMPAMNMTAAYFGYRRSQNELEIAKIKDFKDAVDQLVTLDVIPK